ncbi:hypothetical protein ABC255_16495 [Neobacillus sp. 3P2-tot-E-2]|uniref:hypothetical protein n=1 Tax=Neobacillus sp. 3P2-tot-E-2 TaxID=3132212 RepID=UPI0039A24B59
MNLIQLNKQIKDLALVLFLFSFIIELTFVYNVMEKIEMTIHDRGKIKWQPASLMPESLV